MNRSLSSTLGVLLLVAASTWGCAWRANSEFRDDGDYYTAAATEIEYPDVAISSDGPIDSLPPMTVTDKAPEEYWDLRLGEAVQIALQNSKVLRDLGGTVIRNPAAAPTIYGPAIVETDPRYGVEAALSAFDTQFTTAALFEKNDRALNNIILGGGTRELKQDLIAWEAALRKRSATGTELTARHTTDYDANNAPGNAFFSAWNTAYEMEVRQPWLRGSGLDFNRIAGANLSEEDRSGNLIPGVYNGVLIARINTDVELAEFERSVRDEISNIENTYWDLYFAYRDLNAKIAARDAALETWRRIRALYETGRVGGEADKEAQAREQYFRFEEEVQNALSGRLFDGTRTNNGSSGGSFRATGGVQVAERRLRLLLGLPSNDGRMIRPADEPVMVPIAFDWNEAVTESLARRVELRQQRWQVKKRELELVASRNFLKPRLDTFGRYRWRGFGHDLISANGGKAKFDNAYQNLMSGDYQEWALGAEFSMPLGFRRGHATVRNAQLQLSRERVVLDEQQRQVLYGLSNAIAEMDRAFAVSQTAYNRRLAAREQLAAVEAAYNERPDLLDRLLDAQRRLADAETRYHRLLVEYVLAVKNVHFEKGSLLDHTQVYLAEGPWPGKAYHDAARREGLRGPERPINYVLTRPARVVSRGPVGRASVQAAEEVQIGTVDAPAPPTETQDGNRSEPATQRPKTQQPSAPLPPLPVAEPLAHKPGPTRDAAEPEHTPVIVDDTFGAAPLPSARPVVTKAPAQATADSTMIPSPQVQRPATTRVVEAGAVPAHLSASAAWPSERIFRIRGENGEWKLEKLAAPRESVGVQEVSMPRPDLESYREEQTVSTTRRVGNSKSNTGQAVLRVEATEGPTNDSEIVRMKTPEVSVPSATRPPTTNRDRRRAHPTRTTGQHVPFDRRSLDRNPHYWDRAAGRSDQGVSAAFSKELPETGIDRRVPTIAGHGGQRPASPKPAEEESAAEPQGGASSSEAASFGKRLQLRR